MEFNELEIKLKEFYSNLIRVKVEKNYTELYLPIYLDDTVIFSLFISKNIKNEIVLSTNLLSELEYTLHKKREIKINIRKNYYQNNDEFSEIKKALIEEKIKVDSDILEYIVKDSDEKNLYKEIICYSEKVKSYYNNLYNILLYRYAKETKSNTKKTYYQQFKDVMKEINKNLKLDEHKKTISTYPIYTSNEKIITAAKDLDSLAKLYFDINLMDKREKKGLLYLGEQKGNQVKIKEMEKEFERINFRIISSKEISKDKISKEIEEFVNG